MIARFSFALSVAVSAVVVACSAGEPTPADDIGPTSSTPPGAVTDKDGATADGALATLDAGDAKAPKDGSTTVGKDANGSCTPIFPKGTTCSDCVNDLCTAELAACNGDCDCRDMNECGVDCVVTTGGDFKALMKCIDECQAIHPVGNAKYQPLANCMYYKCSATADGGTGACP
jgi:hypothetical protein